MIKAASDDNDNNDNNDHKKVEIPIESSMEASIQPLKLLVVDDDLADITISRRAALAAGGVEITTASDGRDALLKLENFTPDCILLDLNMAGMNGLEFLKVIKSPMVEERLSTIPVFVLSTSNRQADISQAYRTPHNANLYYIKPSRFKDRIELMNHIKQIVSTIA